MKGIGRFLGAHMQPQTNNDGSRGIRIGKYEVVAHIATGGMGAVYRARDTVLHREVALKVLNPELTAQPEILERFRREARAAACLQHENIVNVFEIGEDKGAHFIAMEFIEGDDLYTYVCRKGKLGVDEACEMLRQALGALQHAYEQKIVHRDIKPSNFLLAVRNGKTVLKLTDMGLARQQRDDECRLTRAGTTVGTIDYMSPEQAKDSDAADIRSDIYSLGCTLFHLLTGRAPFPEGSVVERMYKHLETPAPNIRELNAEVPPGLAYIVAKMLSKKPEERFQTPAEVLDDLERMDTLGAAPLSNPEVLAGLLDGAATEPAPQEDSLLQELAVSSAPRAAAVPLLPRKRKRSEPAAQARPARARSQLPVARALPLDDDEDEADAPTLRRPKLPFSEGWANAMTYAMLGLAALIVLGGGIAVIAALRKSAQAPAASEPPGSTSRLPKAGQSGSGTLVQSSSSLPTPPRFSSSSIPVTTLDADALKRDLESPWTVPARYPGRPNRIEVSRRFGEDSANQVRTVSAAAAAAGPEGACLLEIEDNGPFFQQALQFADRQVTIRAGKGYRPLLVWTVPRNADVPAAFLAMRNGSLILEGIDVVLNWEEASNQPVALISLSDSEFRATGCTFSAVGPLHHGLAAVRCEGSKNGLRCRLTHCLVRGDHLSVLELQAPSAEVLVESSLLVGGEQPLFRIACDTAPYRSESMTTVRLVHSTAVAADCLLELRGKHTAEPAPALRWLGWESVMARSSHEPGGRLVAITSAVSSEALDWRSVKCVFAGWKTLLVAPESNGDLEWSAWSRRFSSRMGDQVTDACWPEPPSHELGVRPPGDFAITPSSAVAYRSTAAASAASLVGCEIKMLPPTRDRWVQFVGDGSAISFPEVFSDQPAPEIPHSTSEAFEGKVIGPQDVEDLGVYLQKIQKTRQLGERVVLRLKPGDWRTSAIHVHGVHLVLHCEPGPDENNQAVVIEQQGQFAVGESLIEVNDGSLDIIGGKIQLHQGGYPAHVIKVTGGDLHMHGCRIHGPLPQTVDVHRSLLRVENLHSGPTPKRHQCVIDSCIFFTAATVLELAGTELDLRMQQCLAAAGQDLVHIDTSTIDDGRFRIHCLLERNTIAARRAVINLDDSRSSGLPLEPYIVVARNNMVWAPYGGPQVRSGVLLAQHEALARGLLLWNGAGNVYDQRLSYFAASAGDLPAHAQPFSAWTSLWARADGRILIPDDKAPSFELRLLGMAERLQAPSGIGESPPGADLVKLRIVRKQKGS